MADTNDNPGWERGTIEKLLMETLKEQRRTRRWKNFFKLLFFIYLSGVVALMFIPSVSVKKPHAAMVEINGVMSSDEDSNADLVVRSLDKAFKSEGSKGIILKINSPGGSPVEANVIYNEIKRLHKKYPNKPIYAVCTDVCASAAYFVAAATDDIYADPSSMVGSIGVLIDGFGFVDTMQKLGVSRRLITAGSNKGFLDPFSPTKPEDQVYAQKMLDIVHQEFIQRVVAGRGTRLKQTPELFSGLIWTGTQAKELGLIDDFASPRDVARDKLHATQIIDYTRKKSPFDRLSNEIGLSLVNSVFDHFKTEAMTPTVR